MELGLTSLTTKGSRNPLRTINLKDEFIVVMNLNYQKKTKNKVAFFSKRFAAREAFSKALGTGFSSNLSFKDIEITNDKKGMPKYVDNKKIIKIVQKKYKIKKFNSFLSISDEKDYSTAFAIIQSI